MKKELISSSNKMCLFIVWQDHIEVIIFKTVQGSTLWQCVVALSRPHSGYERIMLSLAADAIFAKAKDGSGGAKVS